MKRLFFACCALGLVLSLGIGCGGGSNNTSAPTSGSDSSTSGSTNPPPNIKSFSATGSPITINDIVNGTSSNSTSSIVSFTDQEVSASATSAFYFGRFYYVAGTHLFSGTGKFKLNKENDNEAFFSDFTLDHLSEITGLASHNNIVTSSTNLAVSPSFNATRNHVEISDATHRFVRFDLDFGNNAYFGDISNAGVIFSSDFSTMVGGNERTFFFIAQKIGSQPDVSLSAIMGNWKSICFRVDPRSGAVTIASTSTVNVSGVGGNGFTAFTGLNSLGNNFDGELTLTDATSGAFFYGFGSGGGTPTAREIDGAFLVSADQSLVVGYDLLDNIYFAVER